MIALRKQISRWLDGEISDQEMRTLEATLKEDEAARQCYFEYMTNHAALCNRSTGKEQAEAVSSLQLPSFGSELSPTGSLSPTGKLSPSLASLNLDNNRDKRNAFRFGNLLTMAAGILLAITLSWAFIDSPDFLQNQIAAVDDLESVSQPILSLIEPKSEDCRWYVEEVSRHSADTLKAGDVIRVTHGKLAMQYANGTKVLLHSPAAFQLINEMRARLIVGRLTATVPEEGIGFSVITPQATVIDLGTEFGLEVDDDGATDVVVFKGEVDVDYHDKTNDVRRLRMGEAVRLDAIGTASRIVSINGITYSDQALQRLDRPAIISEVRDNIERDSSLMNFYEIVRGGLQEDSLAYVDRIAHEYNGDDSEGIPSFLLNGDYVKMFNNDKLLNSFRIDVCLSMPANLYVLLDNRLEIPEWLKADFRDTGEDIGLDGGPFQSVGPHWHNAGPSGVGPGESIDDVFSVWVKEVKEPGVVQLGPLGINQEEGANMYGLVATPLNLAL